METFTYKYSVKLREKNLLPFVFFEITFLYVRIKISTWQYNALCRQHSSNLFFPPATFEKKEDREKREAKAKAVCNGCPVKVNCLEEAKEIEEPFGIWGGLNEVERKRNLIFS